jgi:hypothetical protein
MAKKTPAPQAPAKVSQLPLPISDSPLVIDLPDGQKLVIGKMAEGSVIEVATWRGTGRPDSRTSRLMLGMSPGNLSDDAGATTGYAGGPKEKKPEGFAKYLYIAKNVLKTIAKLAKKLPVGKLKDIKLGKISLPKRTPKQPKQPKQIASSSSVSTMSASSPSESKSSLFSTVTSVSSKESKADSKADSNEDVDDWLAQIIKKAESNSKSEAKSKATVNTPAKPVAPKKKAPINAKKSAKGKK